MILILVLVPGFLFALTFLKSIANIETSELRFLLTTITLGVVVHVVVFFWTIELLRIYDDDPQRLYDHTKQLLLWAVLTIFVLPVGLGLGLGRLARTDPVDRMLTIFGFGYIDMLPSAWEYIFHKPKGAYVRISLKDGRVIGGVYSTGSFATDPPNPSDIYVEQVWLLDEVGNFVTPVPTTRGVWVSHDSISYIEFLEGLRESREDSDEQFEESAEVTTTAEPTTARQQREPAISSGKPEATSEDAEASDQARQ